MHNSTLFINSPNKKPPASGGPLEPYPNSIASNTGVGLWY